MDAARREVYEETSLEINITSMIGVSSNQITPNLHTNVTVFTADVIAGIPKAGDDLVELNWLSKNTPFPIMAFEADKLIMKKYFENHLIRIPIDHNIWINNHIGK